MVIDVHNHFYPGAYLEEIAKGRSRAKMGRDASGNPVIFYEGDFNIVDRGHRDADFRLGEISGNGIDIQVLTMTTPGVHIEEEGRGVELARAVNEGFSEVVQKSGGRFQALASLPLQAPDRAARELEYAVKTLGLKGGTLFTNVNGKTLDLPEFEPIFEVAVRLSAPLFIHPTTPSPSQAFLDYRLVATVGFPTDTTLCIARLIFAGVLDRYPGLKIISSHLGGTLPYLAERLDRGYRAYPECRKIERAPSEYLKEIFYDCVLFHRETVEFAVRTIGATQFMAGSDYPHQIGSLAGAVRVVESLRIPEQEKEMIRSGNARRVFGL
ncbi:MAG TPA: amidohydrolase [Firmicutes bacterium]|nr:amidohydrolase [Candidatus Fermentithermobacillaceae bacterium]